MLYFALLVLYHTLFPTMVYLMDIRPTCERLNAIFLVIKFNLERGKCFSELICLDEITFCKSGHFEDILWYIKAMTTYMISWCEWYATNNNAAGKLPLPKALWVWINGSSIHCWWRWRGTLEHFICNKKREEVLFAFHSK